MAKTPQEWIDDMHRKISAIEKTNEPFRIAVFTVVADQSRRIFSDGLKSDGGRIGSYSTKKGFYVNPNLAPRKTGKKIKGIEGLNSHKGKTGKSKFKNGNSHKTTYVQNYKDFRNRIGRRIDTVNLNLSGELQKDFMNSPGGKTVKPKKINQNYYVVSIKQDINIQKLHGLEKKYGKIFNLTSNEKKKLRETLIFELRKFLAK